MRKIILVLLAVGLLFSLVSGCTNQEKLQESLDYGYKQGKAEGYDIGFTAGLASTPQDINIAYRDGYKAGENVGYDRGYEAGYAEGEDKGYERGEDLGYERGYENGYQNGFWAGEEEASAAYHTIAEDSYYQGYTEGYADGFEAKSSTVPTNLGFVGGVNSDIYHYPWCVWAQQIYPQNEIWFDSVEDAKAHGYRPCKVCKPPGSVEANYDPWEELEAVERFKELFK